MSFGFDRAEGEVQCLKDILQDGLESTVIFAATSNEGNHERAAWPGRSYPEAIGIHSSNDHGTKTSAFTPERIPLNENFMVVGESIKSTWPNTKGGGYCVADGTSFSAPAATAMAALVMAFVNQTIYKGTGDKVEHAKRLEQVKAAMRKPRGMRRLLISMSKEVEQHYHWISPKLLWKDYKKDDGSEPDLEDSNAYAWEVIKKAFED
jgi:hypothetical protein